MIDNIHLWPNEDLLELIDIFNRLPVWLKVVLTCDSRYFRSHRFLRRRFDSISIDERSRREDIERFVQVKTNLPIKQLKPLIDKSENNFSFVSKSLELVNEGFIRPYEFKSIKPGLNGLYTLLLTRFKSLFTGNDLKLAQSILSLYAVTTSRGGLTKDYDYVYKRVRLRHDHLKSIDQIFYIIKRMFLDSTSELFHSTLHEKLSSLKDEAYACETLYYWHKLCKFESQSTTRKTSTPLVPLASIEFIDQDHLDTSSTSSSEINDIRHQRHLYYLSRFRHFYHFYSQIDHKMDEIFDRYKHGSQSKSQSSEISSFDISNERRRSDVTTTYNMKYRNSSIISRFSNYFLLCC